VGVSEQMAKEILSLSLPIWPEMEESLMVTLLDKLKQVLSKQP